MTTIMLINQFKHRKLAKIHQHLVIPIPPRQIPLNVLYISIFYSKYQYLLTHSDGPFCVMRATVKKK